jgi:hypothetical protein
MVSQDQNKKKTKKTKKTKNKNYRQKKLKTWTVQIKQPHTDHKRTKLQTPEQQTWTHTYINTWSQKTQVAKNDTPKLKSQKAKGPNYQHRTTNLEKNTHIHTDLEHTRDNKTTQRFRNRFCFRLKTETTCFLGSSVYVGVCPGLLLCGL